MARKARQRISYVLPLANSQGGHRLGVNGLAVDTNSSILYSGGRDGLICAWDLGFDLEPGSSPTKNAINTLGGARADALRANEPASLRKQVQAHTHWVNDLLLTQTNSALVSASSDITVKLWRPHSEESHLPTTVGLHSDYVKCLASPGTHSDWVASGGLDHKIRLWDLNGGGEKLQIDVREDSLSAKGSVYALSAKGTIMSSGGPESIVRLWDPRTGKRITKFVGHTDNVRDILIDQSGNTIMTASSDQSVKVWSITAGRCMYTLTMHNDSVWSLHSDHPQLCLFYSSDRSGLVAKTDVRFCDDMDEGRSIALAQEQDGVNKIVAAGGFLWTATSSSSINRWQDVDSRKEIQLPELSTLYWGNNSMSRTKEVLPLPSLSAPRTNGSSKSKLPLSCMLRISNNAPLPGQKLRDVESATVYSGISSRKMSEAIVDQEFSKMLPYYDLPVETIEGQHGLIKHLLLNDKRRVLTLDTAGDVTMWDLLNCLPLQSFGKRHLDDVRPEVDTVESVANWCGVDTRTGRLAVILEENYCFDAEVYADEFDFESVEDFRDDQRINLGKWVLRHLFANFIDEELVRDAKYREQLVAKSSKPNSLARTNAPYSIQLPTISTNLDADGNQDDAVTPKAINGVAGTPGSTTGIASLQVNGVNSNSNSQSVSHIPSTIEERSSLDRQISQDKESRTSTDKSLDYFSNNASVRQANDVQSKSSEPLGDTVPEASVNTSIATSSTEGDKDEKTSSLLFGKKFRMNFPKKLGRSSVEVKSAVVDEKSEESDKSEEKEDKPTQDNLLGTIQRIRYEYEKQDVSHNIPTAITLSPLSETPLLHHPAYTTVLIQEESPDAGGTADLYRGTVGSVGADVDLIERYAPTWLGDLLLRNRMPQKDVAKVSFVLLPYQDLLPSVASQDGNTRLTANRMLRAKKILGYVAERLEPPDQSDPLGLKPEEYLELYCHNQLVDHNTTLGTLRAHIWRNGGDVIMYYKSNGRKPGIERMLADTAAAMSAAETSGKVGPTIHN